MIATFVERRSTTPAQVIFLPSFWMLVPGSIGLAGVSELVVQQNANGLADLVTTVVTVLAIALGILVGASFQHRPRLMVAEGVSPETVEGRSSD